MVIMAGMLPGVEFARKRRLRQCSVSGIESNHPGVSSMPRNNLSKELHGWTLASIAREAKERLDEKFKSQRASVIKRHSNADTLRLNTQNTRNNTEDVQTITRNLQSSVYNSSKKGMRKLISWSKLAGLKASDLAECAVCLEEFRTGEQLVHLPCAHRFHSSCVMPWLETHSHCPVCRTMVCTGT